MVDTAITAFIKALASNAAAYPIAAIRAFLGYLARIRAITRRDHHRHEGGVEGSADTHALWFVIESMVKRAEWNTVRAVGNATADDVLPQLRSPELETYMNWLGAAAMALGRDKEAASWFEEALDVCGHSGTEVLIRSNWASLCSRQGDFCRSSQLVDQALKVNPRSYHALYNGACIASRRQDIALATSRARALLDVYPEFGMPNHQFASTLMNDPAMNWFRDSSEFKKLFPRLVASRETVGITKSRMGTEPACNGSLAGANALFLTLAVLVGQAGMGLFEVAKLTSDVIGT